MIDSKGNTPHDEQKEQATQTNNKVNSHETPRPPESNKPLQKEGKETSNVFTSIRRTIFNWNTFSLFLSHHPACETFDTHVFKIGRVKLCKGCILGYPVAYALPFIFLFWQRAQDFLSATSFLIQTLWWFVIGCGLLTIGSYFLGRFSIFINDLSKIFRGAWAGFLVIAILGAHHWYVKLIPALILVIGLTILGIKRGINMNTICKNCEWKAEFNNCPGWKVFLDSMDQGTITVGASSPAPFSHIDGINTHKENEPLE